MVLIMVFNITFNNISAISWRSVLLVKEIGVPAKNHRPACSYKSNYHTIMHDHDWLGCLVGKKNCLPFANLWVYPRCFGGVRGAHLFGLLCFVFLWCLLTFCILCSMLPVYGLSILGQTFRFSLTFIYKWLVYTRCILFATIKIYSITRTSLSMLGRTFRFSLTFIYKWLVYARCILFPTIKIYSITRTS